MPKIPIKPLKISIITPSYNQGQFIERTIQSVLIQKYPYLEYIIMDGGSTDQTLTILKKYNSKITWESKKDYGQTNAINKGLRKSSGDIVAYLNSDDTYEPKTFQTVATFFSLHPNESFVYGHGRLIDTQDREIGFYNDSPMDYEKLFSACGISQPTCFWRRELLDTIGYFDETYRFTMDYDYWIRTSKLYQLYFLPTILANSRIHKDAKTSSFTHLLHQEAIKVELKHYGKVHYDWIFTYTDSEYGMKKQTKEYFRYMVIHSLKNYIRYNHTLPRGRGLEIILSWVHHAM